MNQIVCSQHAASRMQRRRRFHLAAVAALMALGAWPATPALAVVLVEDNFNDADRNNDGVSDDGNASPVATNDGIKWLAIGGQTTLGVQRPGLTIVDDSVEGGIGGGNALNIASMGANNEFMAVFGQTVSLGPTIGSELKLSFDVRVLDLLLPNTLQTFRFGLYRDSDSQFGMNSVNADNSVTTWGVTDGWFDGANTINNTVGPINDFGVYARVKLGTSAPSANDWRIHEELNANAIMGGTGDNDLVAQPTDFNAMAASALDSNEARHVILKLSRVAANESGNTIMHTLEVDGISFSGHDSNGTGSPSYDSEASFDYFAASTTISIANYVIDNFKIESIIAEPPAGLAGDFNDDKIVDAADYTVWRDSLGSGFNLNGNGDETGGSAGIVDEADYAWWKQHFGATPPGAGSGQISSLPVPEPSVGWMLAVVVALVGRLRVR